jgi:ESCRT-I complex subunit VPS28
MEIALNMDELVRLYTTNVERERFETRATLYGIIFGLDYPERAYVRDVVTAAECASLFCLSFGRSHVLMGRYSPACARVLSQYKMMSKLVEEDVPSVHQFMSQYRVGNVVGHAHAQSRSQVPRWISPPPYTESK